ncbi:MAG: FkbM family methyltransferase [Alphaproteobacteria bacterium]|nr:FkbM family methyltransferase [Alphaproteobacteria bacterium]
MSSLINFLSYMRLFIRKSVSHSHFGIGERFRVVGVLTQLLIKAKYHPHKPVVQRGFGFTMHAPDPQLLLQLVLEIFMEEVYYFDCDKSGPQIIDGGANIGISVLYFSYRYPGATIIAIEPNPAALVYLRKNIRANKLNRVTVIAGALAADSEGANLICPPTLSLLNASLTHQPSADTLHVATYRLSELLKGKWVDLVKLDIEGAEEAVIRETADQGEIHNAKQYIIESHPNPASPEGAAILASTFIGIGYRFVEKAPRSESSASPHLINFRFKSPKFRTDYQIT